MLAPAEGSLYLQLRKEKKNKKKAYGYIIPLELHFDTFKILQTLPPFLFTPEHVF